MTASWKLKPGAPSFAQECKQSIAWHICTWKSKRDIYSRLNLCFPMWVNFSFLMSTTIKILYNCIPKFLCYKVSLELFLNSFKNCDNSIYFSYSNVLTMTTDPNFEYLAACTFQALCVRVLLRPGICDGYKIAVSSLVLFWNLSANTY